MKEKIMRTLPLTITIVTIALLVTVLSGMAQTSNSSDATLEQTAERFFQSIVEGKPATAFQEFEMSAAIRSLIQTGGSTILPAINRQFGGVGELQKKQIVQLTPQTRSVELCYSGKTDSFKVRITFQEKNQIGGIHILPWTAEQPHGGTPIQLETPTGTIYGTLLEPEQTTKPMPVVLILAGSGPTDRNGNNQFTLQTNAYRLLAEALQANGIASVRFDKRAIGASAAAGADESKLHFDHLVDDTVRWIELLSQDKRFSKIVVLGHSEGSLIGMLACIQSNKAAGFISLCGPGKPIDEVIREQYTGQPQSVKDTLFPILDALKQGKTVEKVPDVLLSIVRPSVQPYMISWMKYDPRTEIQKLTIPVLIVQGTTDIQVSIADAEKLSEANPKAKKVIIKDMAHALKKSASATALSQQSSYTDPKLPLHEDLMPNITEFIAGIK